MRRRSTAGMVVVVLASAAQFVRLSATNPPVRGDLAASAEIKGALHHACYDCHSNETVWPWYSAVAPISWLIRHDVSEGRQRLNFSDWAAYESDPETAAQKLGQIASALTNGDMAPAYYRLLHADARLTTAQRDRVIRWAKQEEIKQRARTD